MKSSSSLPRLGLSVIALAMAFSSQAQTAKKGIEKPTVYVVGYSHLDTQWCWTYPQVIRDFIPNTLHENFAMFEKYPDYVFNWTGSNRYRFMKEYYPEDYAKLKKYIAQKRWLTAGSSVEEGDVNSPSEESLIRQVMYGNQFFRREFGTSSSEYMLPDCFGFPASLPSILAHAGLNGFSTQKLTWGSAVGIPFNVGKWVGPDGRYVVAGLNAGDYNGTIRSDLTKDPAWIKRLQEDKDKSGVAADYMYYGVGDRGGAPAEGGIKNLMTSLHSDGPVSVFGGRADQLFNDLSQRQINGLPVYKGDLELTQHSAGSLTSQAAMKRWNRKNEILADAAERASVTADLIGAQPYDKSRLTDAWLRFLPGQFHDLMAGTALPLAYNYTWNDEVIAMNEFAGVLQSAVGGVSRTMDTNVRGVPVVVYNPLSIPRSDIVEAWIALPNRHAVSVTGPNGNAVPSQLGETKDGKTKVTFLAKMPSLGYSTFSVESSVRTMVSSELKLSTNTLENAHYIVKIDVKGDVSSIFDKKAKKELLKSPARLAYIHEDPSEYPSWNMDWSDQQKDPRAYVEGTPKIEVAEMGAARIALRVTRKHEGSVFVQTIRLAAGDAGNRVEFDTKIDWQGKESVLKAEFPLTVSNPLATYNWELGTIQRPNNEPKKYEVAAHRWFDLTDTKGDYGVSILDDSKYGSDKPSDNMVRLSLIYTPGVRAGFQHQGTQDWGRNQMLYAVSGHTGSWGNGTQWEAARLNQPLLAFEAPKHAGTLGKSFSMAHVSSPNVSIEAMKQAEDSTETIVRINELAGKASGPVQIKFAAPVISAREVDGQEMPIGPAQVQNGQLVVSTTAYRPKAYAIKFGKAPARVASVVGMPVALPYNMSVSSSGANKTDGNFDGIHRSLPGELIPAKIVSNNVSFAMAPAGRQNAVIPKGQVVPIAAGKSRRLYFLASSANGDTTGVFQVGKKMVPVNIQAWDGWIGQWDNRLWAGKVPELTYDWHNDLAGLESGYIKRDNVAWYADHRRLADGKNDIYEFCYLFRYSIDIPDGVTSVTLPKNQKIRILAATVASNPNDDVTAAHPLYDTFDSSGVAGPAISPAGGTFQDSTAVSISRPMYWNAKNKLRYTLDGSMPRLTSPAYNGDLLLSQDATLMVAEVGTDGRVGTVSKAAFKVNDVTPAKLVEATLMPDGKTIRLEFNEPLSMDAVDLKRYNLQPAAAISSATLSRDGKSVTLALASALDSGERYKISSKIEDRSSKGNLASYVMTVSALRPVYDSADVSVFGGSQTGTRVRNVSGLPVGAKDPWTINLFAKMDKQPGELTILGGFGDGRDSSGAERFIAKFHGKIHFWGGSVDITATEPFDLGAWQMITATFDGTIVRLYKNGRFIGSEPAAFSEARPMVGMGFRGPWQTAQLFNGSLAKMTIWDRAFTQDEVASLRVGMPE